MRNNGEGLAVSGVMCRTKPKYGALAAGLLEDIRAYFQTPEGEAEFQAWLEDPEAVRRAWDEKARADRTCA